MPDITKYERLICILNLLGKRKNLTTEKLAEECGVSVRTIFRDIDSLIRAKVPLYYEKGYKLASEYFLPQINFSAKEYRLLSAAITSSPLNNIAGLRSVLKGIHVKVDKAVLRDTSGQRGRRNDPPIFVVHAEQLRHEDFLNFRTVENAIVASRMISVNYADVNLLKHTMRLKPYVNALIDGLFSCCSIDSKTSQILVIPYRQIERCKRTNRTFTHRPHHYDEIICSLKSYTQRSARGDIK